MQVIELISGVFSNFIIYRSKKSCSEDLLSMIAFPNMRKYRHVFEGNKKKEGRQDPPLLECGGKCSRWQTCISEASVVSWRIE